jgi:CheY-like chemotaxis protein
MLMRQIRSLQDDRLRQIPAIVLTADVPKSDRQAIFAADFAMHISKPVDSIQPRRSDRSNNSF